jgi:hypothetical protein
VSPPELLEALLELAAAVELEVRRVTSDEAQASGVCRLRNRIWVMLSTADPIEQRIAVLTGALRDHAREACEARYLAPAVRAALDGQNGP